MGKLRAQVPTRFDRIKRTLDHYLPDTYTIYEKVTSGFNALGLPIITNTPITYTNSNDIEVTAIPCRLQENRTMREGFKDLGQSNTIDYQELITYSDAPIEVNHVVEVNDIAYEVISINYPTTYSPYKSAFLVHLGQPS